MAEIFVDKIIDKVKENFGSADELYNIIRTANNVVSHDVKVERLLLDESWVNAIETALLSIENILRNPKKSIKEDNLIVAVEKANRVTSKSIQHLSSHSENIRSIQNGEVTPTKIMTTIIDENLAIYENRFIITLLNKLINFVDDRHKIIKKIVEVKTYESLGLDSTFRLGRSRARIKIALDIEDTPNVGDGSRNKLTFAKIESVKRRLSNIRKSNFFISLKSAKPVYPPIIKTNILTKNVDYNNAYKLWVFMGGYTEEGFTVEIEAKEMPCDDAYCDDLSAIATLLTATTAVNHGIRREAFYNIDYRKVAERRYKVVSKVNYTPTFSNKPINVGEEVVNQYYYEKMRENIGKAINIPVNNVIIQEKNIVMPFNKFFKAVTKISNEMYKDLLYVKEKYSKKKNPSKYDKALLELARQKEVIKRAQMLSKLKADELQKTLDIEAKELVKLEKIKFDLEYQSEKKLDKDINEQLRRVASRKVRKRDVKVASNAAINKEDLLDLEKTRQVDVAKTRKILIAERREARERKLLTQLKRKYESDAANARVFTGAGLNDIDKSDILLANAANSDTVDVYDVNTD